MRQPTKYEILTFLCQVMCVPPLYFLIAGEIVSSDRQAQDSEFPPKVIKDLFLYNTTKHNPGLIIFLAYPLHQFLSKFPEGLNKASHLLSAGSKAAFCGERLQLDMNILNPQSNSNNSNTDEPPSLYKIAKKLPPPVLVTELTATFTLALLFAASTYYSLGMNGGALVLEKLFNTKPSNKSLKFFGVTSGITNLFLYWFGCMDLALKLTHWYQHRNDSRPNRQPSTAGNKFLRVLIYIISYLSLYNSSIYPVAAIKNAANAAAAKDMGIFDPVATIAEKGWLQLFCNIMWLLEACLLNSFAKQCFRDPLNNFLAMEPREKRQYGFYNLLIIAIITLCVTNAIAWPCVYIAIFLKSSLIESSLFPSWPQYKNIAKNALDNDVQQPLLLEQPPASKQPGDVYDRLAALLLITCVGVVGLSVFSGLSIALGGNPDAGTLFLNSYTGFFKDTRNMVVFGATTGNIIVVVGGANILGLNNIVIMTIPTLAKRFTLQNRSNDSVTTPENTSNDSVTTPENTSNDSGTTPENTPNSQRQALLG